MNSVLPLPQKEPVERAASAKSNDSFKSEKRSTMLSSENLIRKTTAKGQQLIRTKSQELAKNPANSSNRSLTRVLTTSKEMTQSPVKDRKSLHPEPTALETIDSEPFTTDTDGSENRSSTFSRSSYPPKPMVVNTEMNSAERRPSIKSPVTPTPANPRSRSASISEKRPSIPKRPATLDVTEPSTVTTPEVESPSNPKSPEVPLSPVSPTSPGGSSANASSPSGIPKERAEKLNAVFEMIKQSSQSSSHSVNSSFSRPPSVNEPQIKKNVIRQRTDSSLNTREQMKVSPLRTRGDSSFSEQNPNLPPQRTDPLQKQMIRNRRESNGAEHIPQTNRADPLQKTPMRSREDSGDHRDPRAEQWPVKPRNRSDSSFSQVSGRGSRVDSSASQTTNVTRSRINSIASQDPRLRSSSIVDHRLRSGSTATNYQQVKEKPEEEVPPRLRPKFSQQTIVEDKPLLRKDKPSPLPKQLPKKPTEMKAKPDVRPDSKIENGWMQVNKGRRVVSIQPQQEEGSNDKTACYVVEGDPHLVQCFPDPDSGLFLLADGWDTTVYPDSRYNVWRRALFDTLPMQRDFPLIVPDDLLSLLYDE